MERHKPLRATTPLRRTTRPLRAATALPRPTAPMAPKGARARRVDPIYRQSCEMVDERSKGRCERPGCVRPATDHHHIFGRRSQIGQEWTNRPECLLHLCRECHHEVTVKPAIEWATEMKWLAVARMAKAMNLDWSIYLDQWGESDWRPLQAAADLIRRYQEAA